MQHLKVLIYIDAIDRTEIYIQKKQSSYYIIMKNILSSLASCLFYLQREQGLGRFLQLEFVTYPMMVTDTG